jgi:GTP-binding protein
VARLFPAQPTFLGAFTGPVPESPVPEVLFAGRSNVGKSSAINAIVGAKIARTSSTPGRTQSINLFELPGRLRLVDLPGYGYAKVSRRTRGDWRAMIGDFLVGRSSIALAVALFDARHEPQELDRTLLVGFGELGLPVIGLATKVDAIPRQKQAAAVAKLARGHGLPASAMIPFSATDNIGIEEARAAIAGVVRA